MNQEEIKEAAAELLADIRHTLAWAARVHGEEAREALKLAIREALDETLPSKEVGGA